MKKIKSVLLVLLVIILCGCSTISTNMQVNKDKSMSVTYLITLDKEYLGNKTFNELFSSKNINYLKNNGYTVTDYENELYIFSREEKVLKNKYTADFYVNLTDALTNNSNVLTDMVVPPKVSYEFTLNLPEKSLSNNATDVSEDGKTLKWEFDNIMSGTNNINFSFELYNKQALLVLYVFIGLGCLIILSMIVRFFTWISDTTKKIQKSFFERAQKKMEKNS